MLRKIALAVVMIVPLFALNANALSPGLKSNFTNAALTGPYVINVHGPAFDEDDDIGAIALAGVLNAHADGTFTAANVFVTYGDNSGDLTNFFDQVTCSPGLDLGLSSYTVNADGTGTITLQTDGGDTCWPGGGQLILSMALSRALSGTGFLGMDNFMDTTTDDCIDQTDIEISGTNAVEQCIADMSLNGTIIHQ